MSTATTAEEARAFLQNRLSVLGMWVLVLAFVFDGFGTLLAGIALGDALEHFYRTALTPPNLAIYLIMAGLWLGLRRGRIPTRALWAIDALVLISMGATFALLCTEAATLGFDHSVAVFAAIIVVIARAILVPSTLRRTVLISAAALAPASVMAFHYALNDVDLTPALRNLHASNVVVWYALGITVASVGSKVIFGLRSEVGRARQLGQYQLDDKIGEGGMGVVYRASHSMLRRPTAIKFLRNTSERNPQRFAREVRLTAQLTHPNTVAVYDYGRTPDGVFYYAMELLDGVNLEDLIAREGPLPAGRVIYILRQVADALGEAHGVGLIHRDVKPANIILCERGGHPDVAKVVDFGLVKHLEAGDGSLTSSSDNLVMGTPVYMPPEAIRDPDQVSARSDLYSLGAVGYYLLTGVTVFEGKSVMEVCGHHLHTEPTPPSQRTEADVPSDLETILLRCLEKDPADRFDSAASIVAALDACLESKSWTRSRATGWWADFREAEARVAAGETAEVEAEAVAGARTLPKSVAVSLEMR